MKRILVLSAILLLLVSCATRKSKDLDFDDMPAEKKASSSTKKKSKAEASPDAGGVVPGVVVDPQDLAMLERMTKAVESYIYKGEKKEFTTLCKDKRFDCFVDEKASPARKKKISRPLPPYASGSKMGLQGEKRIQLRYEFYP